MTTNTYTADENGQVFAGRFNRPSWVRNQVLNTWGVVPLSQTWTDVDPALDPLVNPNFPAASPWRANGGFLKRKTAWNGHTSYGGIIYDPPSGGHDDYAGNESFKVVLNADTPTVIRLSNPSGSIGNEIVLDDGLESTGLYADGRVRCPHNYNTAVFYPPLNMYMLTVQGTSLYRSGQHGTTKPCGFDPDTGELVLFGQSSPTGLGLPIDNAGCYNSATETLFYRGGGTSRIGEYNPITNTWVSHGALYSAVGPVCIEAIPDHSCIAIFTDGSNFPAGFVIFDYLNGTYHQPSIAGGEIVGLENRIGNGKAHYLGGGRIAYWNNTTETEKINIIEFSGNPKTGNWNISQVPVSPSNTVTPTAAYINGTFGSFAHHPTLGIFTLNNGLDQPLYFYRYKL